jgi:hypothetical protein
MARLVLTAGQHVAGLLRSVGPMAANWAAQAASSRLLGQRSEGSQLSELPIQTSSDGASMPRIYGRARIAGQVIWASRFSEHAQKSNVSGKGGGASRVDYTYSISFAVGLCEGEIAGLGRAWANGAPLDLSLYNCRIHHGAEDQLPDALIEAIEGGTAPAFRGTSYVVFEDLPLDAFGYRIPNLSFEVYRPVRGGETPQLEERVHGVNLIPGSGEFAYSPQTVMRVLGPGREQAENQHSGRGVADFCAAIDDLQRDLPACKSVQLVVSWFGDDLRCGSCQIRPGVETRDKQTRPRAWAVAGQDRTSAYLISQLGDRPVYGGTPEDAGVIAAIRELKARGFAVTLYPFILMDVPAGNGLPDPHGGVEQAVFPWRGRLSCHPAAGQDGSVDETALAEVQVSNFFGASQANNFGVSAGVVTYSGPAEWRFNRFILHCAALAQVAGGVDGFLIGSEMVGLTTIRGADGSYPAVVALKTLAAEARTLLGAATRVSYAADWTEYSGHQPGGGAKRFHLDPLWSDANIDAVAIDWYIPLSDWRDDDTERDASSASGVHDRTYLAANVAGGEGFDWYYASADDRNAQIRTEISGDLHGEDWVWRYKDLVNWWGQLHHDRPGAVRDGSPTAWVPQSKPIWLTEIGCPAVDKGANQPNVFVDPKSSESTMPWFSDGARDDLVQRRYLDAMLAHWDAGTTNNPESAVYGGAMVPTDLIHVWAWDARPWPDFPARSAVWSDGANWRLGHWLNGRAGLVPVAAIIRETSESAGLASFDVSRLDDLVAGYVIDGPATARSALEPLALVLAIDVFECANGIQFVSAGGARAGLALQESVYMADLAAFEISDVPPFDLPRDVRLSFFDDTSEYRPGQAYARDGHGRVKTSHWQAPIVCDPDLAGDLCASGLQTLQARSRSYQFGLPPSALSIEIGDRVEFSDTTLILDTADGGAERRVSAHQPDNRRATRQVGIAGVGTQIPSPPVRPEVIALDLPIIGTAQSQAEGLRVAAFADPWPGILALWVRTDIADHEVRSRITRPARMGVLQADLPAGPVGRWDRANRVELSLFGGALDSVEAAELLNGANILAIEQADSQWEIIQFATAKLVGPDVYVLADLLRGQAGSNAGPGAISGARCVVLDAALAVLEIYGHETGVPLHVAVTSRDLIPDHIQSGASDSRYDQISLRPYAPVHLRAQRLIGETRLSWTRCSRIAGDDWRAGELPLSEAFERYRLEIMDGETVQLAIESDTPNINLTDSEIIAALGAIPAVIDVRVAQVSDRVGAGRWCRRQLDL